MEEWRSVVGYEGIYEVSNLGNVRSIPRPINRGIRGITHTKTYRNLRLRVNKYGYHDTHLRDAPTGRSRIYEIHRLVASAFIPNPEGKPTVNHMDSNRTNNSVSNLEWATHKENITHGMKHGKIPDMKGSSNHMSRLTAEDVLLLRSEWKTGLYTYQSLADKYGHSHGCVFCVITRRSWGHLKEVSDESTSTI